MAKAKKAAPGAKSAAVVKAVGAAVGKAVGKAVSGMSAEAAGKKGPRKKYLKSRPACQVTFSHPAPEAQTVCIVGEFNGWETDKNPMKKQKNGTFTITLELEAGRAYRYRYHVDGFSYENDHCADWYDPNPYGGDDSVVSV